MPMVMLRARDTIIEWTNFSSAHELGHLVLMPDQMHGLGSLLRDH
jgi:Zn-dependent peptidase ImmA (M78 family)